MQSELTRRVFLKKIGLLGAGVAASSLGVISVISAESEYPEISRQFLTMGTLLQITVRGMSRGHAEDVIADAYESVLSEVDMLDRHQSSSALSVLNSNGHLKNPPESLRRVLTKSLAVYRETRGAFNPSVAPVVQLLEKGISLSPSDQRDLQKLQNMDSVTVSPQHITLGSREMRLTLDGIGKGYVVDMLSKRLTELGAGTHLVNAGGDIVVRTAENFQEPWRIGIQSPVQEGIVSTESLRNAAIATSGNYEQKFSHIIPHAGLSRLPLSTSVVAQSCVTADALATAAFANPAAVDACTLIVDETGKMQRSTFWVRDITEFENKRG